MLVLCPSTLDRRAYAELVACSVACEVMTLPYEPRAVRMQVQGPIDIALFVTDTVDDTVRSLIGVLRLRAGSPRIVVTTGTQNPRALLEWLNTGACGIVLKSQDTADLQRTLRDVAAGHRVLPFDASRLAAGLGAAQRAIDELTRREHEVMLLLAQGRSLRGTAEHLRLSMKTVDTYRTSLFRKLGISNRVELARLAIREGLVDV